MTNAEIIHRIKEVFEKKHLTKYPKNRISCFSIPTITWFEIDRILMDFPQAKMKSEKDGPMIYSIEWPFSGKSSLEWNKFLDGVDTSLVPAFKVNYRNKETLNEDIRFAWELNRLCWLLPLAKSSSELTKETALTYFKDFLTSDNPGYGLRWNSMIELSIQSLSILLLSSILETKLDHKDHSDISAALSHRFLWISKLPSKHSSANNHRIAELIALICIAKSFGWSSKINELLGELICELKLQTCAEGFNSERASDYHLFVYDLLIVLKLLYPEIENCVEFRKLFRGIAQITAEVLNSFQTWPSFGDSDEAAIIGFLVNHVDRASFLGKLSGVKLPICDKSIYSYKDSGFTIVKRNFGKSQCSILMDHGPIGHGSISAHGHADTLAIWIVQDGFPLIIESGTYSYHSNSKIRDSLRSGGMHNTVTSLGESLSKPSGPFLWNPNKVAEGKLDGIIETDESILVEMSASYPRSHRNKGGVFQRSVKMTNSRIEIIDKLIAEARIESHYIISPKLELQSSTTSAKVTFISKTGLELEISTSAESRIEITDVEVSNRYGMLELTKKISIVGKHQNETYIGTRAKVS